MKASDRLVDFLLSGDGRAFVVPLAVAVGLVVGSFLNVVVWRVPRGESVVSPPSACPRCGHRVRRRDNVPVVSWLVLHGRCRDCGAPISGRYPLVEVTTAVLFGVTAWFTGASWVLPALLWLAGTGLALTLIDLDVHRLPDVIVLPSYPVALALLALASVNPGGAVHGDALVRAGLGAAAMVLVYLVLALVYPSGMGLGDVKLAGVLGMYLGWFGWGALLVGGFGAFLLGGVYALGLVLAGRAHRGTGIPFGPWMFAGSAAGIVLGERLWVWYLGSF